jgi:hypothetical protein
MPEEFKYGDRIYYVPRLDKRLTRYLPVTAVRMSLVPPLLILGHTIVIRPRQKQNGIVATDRIGSFWISKEAYKAHRAFLSLPLWRRLSLRLGFAPGQGKRNGRGWAEALIKTMQTALSTRSG